MADIWKLRQTGPHVYADRVFVEFLLQFAREALDASLLISKPRPTICHSSTW
jgi:hypothetical protein